MRFRIIIAPLLCFYAVSANQVYSAFHTITPSRPIRDGETIISRGGTFELGFFSPGDPSKRYVGIWFKKVTPVTVAWVANRLMPVTDGKGVFKVTHLGNLVIENGTGAIVWSSNTSAAAGDNSFAQFFESGNLVLRNKVGDFLWQSFDYPTDTVLVGMKLGINRTSGFDRHLTSWRSLDDPYPGSFTYRLDPSGYAEMMMRQGSNIWFRRGPWNGIQRSGTANLDGNKHYSIEFVLTDEEIVFSLERRSNDAVILRPYLSPSGFLQTFTWTTRNGWMLYHSFPADTCDQYGICGPHGTCIVTNSPVCACLKGFIPKFHQEWDSFNWLNGCVRRTALECGTDIFVKYEGVKLPDMHYSWFNGSMSIRDCRDMCTKNCSCMAYSNFKNKDRGSGCLQWFGDLVDIRNYQENGQELYIRMSARESGLLASNHKKQKLAIEFGFGSAAVVIIGLCLSVEFSRRRAPKRKTHPAGANSRFQLGESSGDEENLELPLFDVATVFIATDNFSMENKIGEGGFGPVYKGVLSDGREIAVKKLSPGSKQGLDEFKNEVIYIAKLQHRNLVKLLGYCIQEVNLLIYEYMPNGSLDSFLFDPMQRKLLDWKKCFDIVIGITRGLVYLHHDSRLRIIHRDLKASNILLDDEMNPKISDFGLAKGFIGNEAGAKTRRVVGTYGYISPEYATHGTFSMKSDVFSYGVVVLEMVSGQRNRGFYHQDHLLNLLGHAWKLFVEDKKPLELLDQEIKNCHDASQVVRCIHVGLLCVQRCPEDRPSMDQVLMMLESEIELPFPKEPGFFHMRNPFRSGNNTSSQQPCSPNEISISQLAPR